VLDGVLGDSGHLRERVAPLGCGARGLVGKDDSGNTASIELSLLRLARNVVATQHGLGFDALKFGQVDRKVEVEDVSAIVAVEVQHSRATIDSHRRLKYLVGLGELKTLPIATPEHNPSPT